ncbi:MAG: hypothetical protein V1788_01220 [Nanoarchaeota archaeon]
MITYKDIYEAAENNPLVFFYFPQSTEVNCDDLVSSPEGWHLFIASDRYHNAASGGIR